MRPASVHFIWIGRGGRWEMLEGVDTIDEGIGHTAMWREVHLFCTGRGVRSGWNGYSLGITSWGMIRESSVITILNYEPFSNPVEVLENFAWHTTVEVGKQGMHMRAVPFSIQFLKQMILYIDQRALTSTCSCGGLPASPPALALVGGTPALALGPWVTFFMHHL